MKFYYELSLHILRLRAVTKNNELLHSNYKTFNMKQIRNDLRDRKSVV